jgi:hypothetical protein
MLKEHERRSVIIVVDSLNERPGLGVNGVVIEQLGAVSDLLLALRPQGTP